jgi:hypothetical protein
MKEHEKQKHTPVWMDGSDEERRSLEFEAKGFKNSETGAMFFAFTHESRRRFSNALDPKRKLSEERRIDDWASVQWQEGPTPASGSTAWRAHLLLRRQKYLGATRISLLFEETHLS